jgi:hypothetical protein
MHGWMHGWNLHNHRVRVSDPNVIQMDCSLFHDAISFSDTVASIRLTGGY